MWISCLSPFQTAKQVLGDLVHLQHVVPDEGDVQGALQTQLPQLLALTVGVEAPMAEQKPNCREVGAYRQRLLEGVPSLASPLNPTKLTYNPALHHLHRQVLTGHLREEKQRWSRQMTKHSPPLKRRR